MYVPLKKYIWVVIFNSPNTVNLNSGCEKYISVVFGSGFGLQVILCLVTLALSLVKLFCFLIYSSFNCCYRLHDAVLVSQPKHYVNPVLLLGFCNVSYNLTILQVCADTKP